MGKREVQAELYKNFADLTKCSTNNKEIEDLIEFFKNNENLLLAESDKSKDVVCLSREQYLEKLEAVFGNESKFLRLKENPLKTDLRQFRKLLKELKPFIDNDQYFRMLPHNAIKKAYGKVKTHKENWPIRPIVSSLNTITSGAEEWILKLLKPLQDDCKYSLDSTKQFSADFSLLQSVFDDSQYEVVSWDVSDMYTNVDTYVVTDHIISTIYSNPNSFFPETTDPNDGSVHRKIIPRRILKKFLIAVLTKFTAFSTAGGYFRQTQGLSMGSKISCLLSNIYMNIIESEVIDKEIKNGNIKYFKRYVDDTILLCKKGKRQAIFEEMNNFCQNINFTEELMNNNEIKFLDTIIYMDSNKKIHLKQYRKTEREVYSNFKLAIMSKNHKIGALCTEIRVGEVKSVIQQTIVRPTLICYSRCFLPYSYFSLT